MFHRRALVALFCVIALALTGCVIGQLPGGATSHNLYACFSPSTYVLDGAANTQLDAQPTGCASGDVIAHWAVSDNGGTGFQEYACTSGGKLIQPAQFTTNLASPLSGCGPSYNWLITWGSGSGWRATACVNGTQTGYVDGWTRVTLSQTQTCPGTDALVYWPLTLDGTATTTTTAGPTTTTTAPTTTTTAAGSSWGCNPPEHYVGGVAIELNADNFGAMPNLQVCGNDTQATINATINTTNCGGCVQGYPSIKAHYDQSSWLGTNAAPPLSSVQSWTAHWNINAIPDNIFSEFGFDLYFGNNCGALSNFSPHGSNQDTMVWVDTTSARGSGGAPTINSHFNLGGYDTTLYQYGTPGVATDETIYRLNSNTLSGSIDLLSVVNAGIANGDLKACDSRGLFLDTEDFGVEVCQPNPNAAEAPSTYTINSFGMDVQTTDGVHHTT